LPIFFILFLFIQWYKSFQFFLTFLCLTHLCSGFETLMQWLWDTYAVALGHLCSGFGTLAQWLWDTCTVALRHICSGFGTLAQWLWDTCAMALRHLCSGFETLTCWLWDTYAVASGNLRGSFGTLMRWQIAVAMCHESLNGIHVVCKLASIIVIISVYFWMHVSCTLFRYVINRGSMNL